MTSPSDVRTLYTKALAYCTRHTAALPDGATLAIAEAYPELAQWLAQADVAAGLGDARACAAALREWMKGWRAAAVKALTPQETTLSLEFPA